MSKPLPELMAMLSPDRMPRHVGVIMDGNGRWAKQRGLPRSEGHREGVERVRELLPFAACELKLEALTLYVFSLENWQRPQPEIDTLMVILEYFLSEEISKLVRDNIRFTASGDIARLPEHIQELIENGRRITSGCTGMILNAAMSYGGRDEVVRAVRNIAASGLRPDEITEEAVSAALDNPQMPDPDLIIRTSGEIRTSNFLLWQAAYSELYFTDTLWPDFDHAEFVKALLDYQHRDRRFGGLSQPDGGNSGEAGPA